MKAISLHQPYASFIAMRWKTIETRDHDRFKGLVGHPIAIHAAMKIDRTLNLTGSLALNILRARRVPLWQGRVVCTAVVAAGRWSHELTTLDQYKSWNRWAMCDVNGKYCLFLEDIQPLVGTVRVRGRQGIFDVPDDVIEEAQS